MLSRYYCTIGLLAIEILHCEIFVCVLNLAYAHVCPYLRRDERTISFFFLFLLRDVIEVVSGGSPFSKHKIYPAFFADRTEDPLWETCMPRCHTSQTPVHNAQWKTKWAVVTMADPLNRARSRGLFAARSRLDGAFSEEPWNNYTTLSHTHVNSIFFTINIEMLDTWETRHCSTLAHFQFFPRASRSSLQLCFISISIEPYFPFCEFFAREAIEYYISVIEYTYDYVYFVRARSSSALR